MIYLIYFDEISKRILKCVPKKDKKYVKKQLSFLDKNFMNYIDYLNENYYRNGGCNGVELGVSKLSSLNSELILAFTTFYHIFSH